MFQETGLGLYALVALASFAAGVMNPLAGGGSFFTLPALVAAGLPAIDANASSTVGLFPSQMMTAFLSRRDLDTSLQNKDISVLVLSLISLVGGCLGGFLLLVTPPSLFSHIVPWLILVATAIFAGGNFLRPETTTARLSAAGVYVAQAAVSIYGGYFGGGIGILMLAALTLYGMRDIRAMNSLKMLLAMLTNAAAVVTFMFTGLVHWPQTLVMAVAAIAGGYGGVSLGRHIPAPLVKGFVFVVGLCLTVFFFVRPP